MSLGIRKSPKLTERREEKGIGALVGPTLRPPRSESKGLPVAAFNGAAVSSLFPSAALLQKTKTTQKPSVPTTRAIAVAVEGCYDVSSQVLIDNGLRAVRLHRYYAGTLLNFDGRGFVTWMQKGNTINIYVAWGFYSIHTKTM